MKVGENEEDAYFFPILLWEQENMRIKSTFGKKMTCLLICNA